VLSCVVNSHDFNQLCYLYGVSVMSMNFSELTCAVYEHFRANTMWFFFFLHCVHYCVVEVLVVVFVCCLSVCLFFNPCCRPILSSWRINVYINLRRRQVVSTICIWFIINTCLLMSHHIHCQPQHHHQCQQLMMWAEAEATLTCLSAVSLYNTNTFI